MTSSTIDFVNNPFDYLIDPSYAGKYDISIGIRYNVY